MKARRYSTEEQIIKAIDSCIATAKACSEESAALEKDIELLKFVKDPGEAWKIEHYRGMQLRLTKRANKLMTQRLKQLASKLGEFRTQTLPFMDGDKSVPVRVK